MRTTRSVARGLAAAATGTIPAPATTTKRKVSETKETQVAAPAAKKPRKPAKTKAAQKTEENMDPLAVPERPKFPVDNLPKEPMLPAKLSFSFEDAKRSLIQRDPRFEDIFDKLPCRPFEHLEQVDPFRWVRFQCHRSIF